MGIPRWSPSSHPAQSTLGSQLSSAAPRARRRANLMLLPSSLFDADDDRIRLTFGHERIPRLLDRWAEDLREHGLAGAGGA